MLGLLFTIVTITQTNKTMTSRVSDPSAANPSHSSSI